MMRRIPWKQGELLFAILALSGCGRRPDPYIAASVAGDYGNARLAGRLPALHERPLSRPIASADTVIRLISFSALGGSAVMRVERRGANWLYVQKTIGLGDDRQRITADSVPISAALVDSLLATIHNAGNWEKSASGCGTGLDGYRVVLEARLAGAYHTIDCWSANGELPPAVRASADAFGWLASRAFKYDRPRAP